MTLGAIVQARLSSRRLPGKVLCPVADKPLLQYLLERLGRVPSLEGVVVATSREASDDRVAEFCARQGALCHRGDLDDVAQRFLGAAAAFGFDAFVRVSGDSPLLDPRLVVQAVSLFREAGADLVTNVFPRSFPPGQSVEVLATSALAAAHEFMTADEREHVTLHFYLHPERVRIHNFSFDDPGARAVRMTVDSPDDLDVARAVVARMTSPHWDYGLPELLSLYREARA